MWNIKAYCLCDKSSRARMVWGSDVKQVAASTEAVSADGGEIGKRKDEFVFVISFHILRVFLCVRSCFVRVHFGWKAIGERKKGNT